MIVTIVKQLAVAEMQMQICRMYLVCHEYGMEDSRLDGSPRDDA